MVNFRRRSFAISVSIDILFKNPIIVRLGSILSFPKKKAAALFSRHFAIWDSRVPVDFLMGHILKRHPL